MGLPRAHPDRATGEVDVAPLQRKRLPDPRACVHQRREQRATLPATEAGLRVQAPAGVQQRSDVLRTVQPRPVRRSGWEPPTASLRDVPCDEFVLDGGLQNRGQRRQCLVDRRRADPAVGHLPAAVPVDVFDRDLVEALAREHRQQVAAEPPLQVLGAGIAQPLPAAAALEPYGREPL